MDLYSKIEGSQNVLNSNIRVLDDEIDYTYREEDKRGD